jgi:branched-chain amino acid transport system substrate-binding protein
MSSATSICARVERVNGELWNIEFATVENVKDPVKAARK